MSILSFSGPRWTTRHLTLAAMLTALEVILGKMSVGNPTVLKVSLGFIATALVGYCLGPWLGGMVMIVNDLILVAECSFQDTHSLHLSQG